MKNIFKTMVLALGMMFCLQPAFAATSDFIDNGDGTVTHKKTGLTWMRCLMGKTWSGSECLDDGTIHGATRYTGQEIKVTFAGYSDWRVPNIDELLSLADVIEDFPKPNDDLGGDRASSSIRSDGLMWGVQMYRHKPVALDVNQQGNSEFALLVRGKSYFSGFLAEKNREAAQEAKKAEKEERERQAKYQKFRKHIKEGDDTTDGVVVQVKGNLVKIQTSESQCTQRDYQNNCKNYVNTSVEKWFKRSEIYPRD
jgi:hypothetical protein